jgi:hypothetical protein
VEKFAKLDRGHIDLQDHGDKVEYRNIKVREIRPVRETHKPLAPQ